MELIFINDYSKKFNCYKKIFLALTQKTFTLLKREENVSLEVNLVNDDFIQQLNREYRGLDKPTDVISFAFLDEVEGDIKIKGDFMVLLGEIFISIDRAIKQAEEYGNTLKREISFLFVHGLLHLLGYDHLNLEDEKTMFALQDQILEK